MIIALHMTNGHQFHIEKTARNIDMSIMMFQAGMCRVVEIRWWENSEHRTVTMCHNRTD